MSKARRLWLVVAFLCAACAPSSPRLVIATTTSVQNSGLLGVLLPAYEAAAIDVHAVGSGLALNMLANGEVALVISHAPALEARLLAAHADWRYQKIAFNRFVIVGPTNDPARIAGVPDPVRAFQQIAAARAAFVSRGDQSGTHEREQALWAAAQVTPGDWLLISGSGMAQALRHADAKPAYTLSDEGTFWQLEKQLSLRSFPSNDPLLMNTYALLYRSGDAGAQALGRWLSQDNGRQIIQNYRVQERAPFTVWPDGCPGATPEAMPCVR